MNSMYVHLTVVCQESGQAQETLICYTTTKVFPEEEGLRNISYITARYIGVGVPSHEAKFHVYGEVIGRKVRIRQSCLLLSRFLVYQRFHFQWNEAWLIVPKEKEEEKVGRGRKKGERIPYIVKGPFEGVRVVREQRLPDSICVTAL